MDFLKEIYSKIEKFFKLRHFVFRTDEYNGTEASNTIYLDQVFEYELINQGTSIIQIDSGLKLYPGFSGICDCRQRFVINSNEKDETVHQFKFLPLDYIVVTKTTCDPTPPVPPLFGAGPVPGCTPTTSTPVIVPATPGEIEFNKLIVISKTYSKPRR